MAPAKPLEMIHLKPGEVVNLLPTVGFTGRETAWHVGTAPFVKQALQVSGLESSASERLVFAGLLSRNLVFRSLVKTMVSGFW